MQFKEEKGFIILSLSILLCIMSVGYAILGQTLTINGTAHIEAGSWSVHFDTDSITQTSVNGTVPQATITATATNSMFSIGANLQSSPDSVTYNIDVKNDGTINAKVDSIVFYINDVVVDSSSVTAVTNGNMINNDIHAFTVTGLEVGDEINKNTSKTLTIKMENKSSVLPTFPDSNDDGIDENYVTNFKVRITYVQN